VESRYRGTWNVPFVNAAVLISRRKLLELVAAKNGNQIFGGSVGKTNSIEDAVVFFTKFNIIIQ
jgi:hypothetical protein